MDYPLSTVIVIVCAGVVLGFSVIAAAMVGYIGLYVIHECESYPGFNPNGKTTVESFPFGTAAYQCYDNWNAEGFRMTVIALLGMMSAALFLILEPVKFTRIKSDKTKKLEN